MYSHIIVLVQLIQLNVISFVYDGEQSFLAVVSERMKRAPDLSLKKMDASRGKDWRKLLWQFGLILVKLGLNPSAVAATAIFLWERESNYPNC